MGTFHIYPQTYCIGNTQEVTDMLQMCNIIWGLFINSQG